MIYRSALGILVFYSIGLIGCTESLLTEPEKLHLPDSTSEVLDTRSWSSPKVISIFPPDRISYSSITSLAGERDELHLLLTLPDDTLQRHIKYVMAYISFQDADWKLNTIIEGLGIFKPATILPANQGKKYIFWSGIREDVRESPTSFRGSDVYYCIWEESACSTPTSLFQRPEPGLIRFHRAIQDPEGIIHLPIENWPYVHMLELDRGNVPAVTFLGAQLYPIIAQNNDTQYLIYVDRPGASKVGNDVYLRTRKANSPWEKLGSIFQDPNRHAHHPTVIVDKEGNIHVAFYTLNPSGTAGVVHLLSSDGGSNWVTTQLFENQDVFGGVPQFTVDTSGVVHLTWEFLGALPYREKYHATWRNEEWSEPQRLFPELDWKNQSFITTSTDNRVHLVFRASNSIYHAIYE